MIASQKPTLKALPDQEVFAGNGEGGEAGQKAGPLKLRFSLKLASFGVCVVALSWVFEGLREVRQDPSLMHIAFLVFASLLIAGLLFLQAFWIYIEEKSKGTLKKRIPIFDSICSKSSGPLSHLGQNPSCKQSAET